jgi:hypothetical protein
MKNMMDRKSVILSGLVLVAVSSMVAGASAIGFSGVSKRYEIAETFHGWATVTYGNPACRALEENGAYVVIRVDAEGKGCTSSPMPAAWRFTRFAHVDRFRTPTPLALTSDDTGMIQAWSTRSPQQGNLYPADIFFVGTSGEMNAASASRPN